MSEDVLRKKYGGELLTTQEEQLFDQYPQIGADLLENIPRMEAIGKIIRFQEKRFDGTGSPTDMSCVGRAIPLESRMLKVVLDFDTLEISGMDRDGALTVLQEREGWYDPVMLDALKQTFEKEKTYTIMELSLNALTSDMILAEGVRDDKGQIIVTKGQKLTDGLLMHLMHVAHQKPIEEPIKVIVPIVET